MAAKLYKKNFMIFGFNSSIHIKILDNFIFHLIIVQFNVWIHEMDVNSKLLLIFSFSSHK